MRIYLHKVKGGKQASSYDLLSVHISFHYSEKTLSVHITVYERESEREQR